ncbi:transcript variant X2 [Nothobranchius furzeri]|uniref:Deoxyribonuclease n=1 Tax=Nothobranchius furzeri TaxID=105023 RepID=A0A9D2XXW2_NOTFU|nr:transcript variant X2 [Nothobranchius furzeri]
MRSIFLLLFLLTVADAQRSSEFRICAFNLHHYGDSKSRKSDVMLTLARASVTTRSPVLLLFRYDSTSSYQHVSSERLGRSESYQEQYVFIYRTETVTVTDLYQYPDDLKGDEDAFSREPFVVRFKAPRTGQVSGLSGLPYRGLFLCFLIESNVFSVIKEFVLIPQHTTPSNTTKELDALYDVLQRVKKMWRTENVMLLGDFNADCGYLAKKNRKNVRLITDKNLYWLIPDDSDTTVKLSTSCSYDRIVVNGETFNSAVVPSSAQPFNFQQEYGLTEEQTQNIKRVKNVAKLSDKSSSVPV